MQRTETYQLVLFLNFTYTVLIIIQHCWHTLHYHVDLSLSNTLYTDFRNLYAMAKQGLRIYLTKTQGKQMLNQKQARCYNAELSKEMSRVGF